VSPWYEAAFGEDYLALYPHRNLAEAKRDVRGIIDLIDPPRDQPLLDLCCGAGRHLHALHESGFSDLSGVDLSGHLLDVARRRLDEIGGTRIRLERSDMRTIPYKNGFETVLSLFTSFGYFVESTEDEVALRAARYALRPGGTFVIDTLNRTSTIAELDPTSGRTLDGVRVRIARSVSPDGLRVEKETRIEPDGEAPRIYRESVRMYSVDEMGDMLIRAGFVDVRFFGALDGRAHDDASPRMVCVARRPAEDPA